MYLRVFGFREKSFDMQHVVPYFLGYGFYRREDFFKFEENLETIYDLLDVIF